MVKNISAEDLRESIKTKKDGIEIIAVNTAIASIKNAGNLNGCILAWQELG